MSAIDILYIVVLMGSLAFGLEALLLGLGGKLMMLYRRRRAKTLAIASGIGLAIVAPAIITSAVLALQPIYFCVLVLVYTFVAGRIIKMAGKKMPGRPQPPLPPRPSELEIVAMLRKRGYGKLVKKGSATSPRVSSLKASELEIVEELRDVGRGKSARKKRKT